MSDPHAYVVGSEAVPEETFEWGTLRWLCNAALCPGAAQTLGICHILPGRRNPVHYHPNCEEVLHLLVGGGRHSYDGQWVDLQEGDTIRIPAGVRHNLENTGPQSIVCLIAFSSGQRETVFLE
jgi:quercetin dioxygenase-like cupin family protein